MDSHYHDLRESAEAFIDAVVDSLADEVERSGLTDWIAEDEGVTLERDGLRFTYEPTAESVASIASIWFHGEPLTVDHIIASPDHFSEVADAVDRVSETDVEDEWDRFNNALSLFADAADLPDVIEAIQYGDETALQHFFDDVADNDSEINDLLDADPDEPVFQEGGLAVFAPTDTRVQTRAVNTGTGDIPQQDITTTDGNNIAPDTGRTFDDLVVDTRSSTTNTTQEAYVVGEDDTPSGFFIHPVDRGDLPADAGEITLEDIYEAMGFDRQLWDDAVTPDELDIGTRVRIQGDLALERQDEDSISQREQEQLYREPLQQEVEQRLTETLEESDVDGVTLDVDVTEPANPSVSVWLTPDDPSGLESFLGLASEVEDTHQIDDDVRTQALITLVQQELQAEAETLLSDIVDAGLESGDLLTFGQENVPIDNHLVVVGDAEVVGDRDSPPVRIRVPSETMLHCLHDEHEQVSITLSPGVYRLYLLPRGGIDDDNRGRQIEAEMIEELEEMTNDEIPGLLETEDDDDEFDGFEDIYH